MVVCGGKRGKCALHNQLKKGSHVQFVGRLKWLSLSSGCFLRAFPPSNNVINSQRNYGCNR